MLDRKAMEVALLFKGIRPPPEGKNKTTCPQCSHLRKKTHRPCLLVKTQANKTFRVYCFNCGWSMVIE